MKRYSYEVAQVGMWDGVVLNEDGEAMTGVIRHEDACNLRWEWLSQEERDEIVIDCEVAEELAAEERANRELSYTP